MHKHVTIIALVMLAILTPQIAGAQVDAKEAYAAGKALFAAEKFEEARDKFRSASFTDGKNAEVFLWLGKANYQIGEIDKAMAAWTRTLQLAPKHAYAIKMLKALKGHAAKPAARIKLIKTLIAEGLYSTAGPHCQSLIGNEAATDAQRAEALRLQAEVLLETRNAAGAVVALQEAAAKYPTQQDKPQTALLLGRARVKMGGKSLASGLAMLNSVVKDFAKTPQAAAAQYELITIGLSQKTDAAGAAALQKWIAANAGHRLAGDATTSLISVYLSLANQTAAPKPNAKLSAFEVQAITLAGKQIAASLRTTEAAATHKLIVSHLQKRYAAAKAYPAAIAGLEMLAKAPLPKTPRAKTLMTLAQLRATVAIDKLTELARAGKLPAGKTPKPLTDAVAGYKAVMAEFPLQSTWTHIAVLAHQANKLAVSVPFPPKVTAMKAQHAWAIEIALEVIKADADSKAVANAITIVTNIEAIYAGFKEDPARLIPMTIHAKLLAAVSKDNSARDALVIKQIDLLSKYASQVFAGNIKAGLDETNKTLTAHQTRMLAAMAQVLAKDTSQGPAMLTRLSAHLRPWRTQGHYDLVRKAYETLAAAMPASQKPAVQLEIIKVWVAQAAAAHSRLLASGFTVPRKLDPAHEKALIACYAIQDQRSETDAIVMQARTIAAGIAQHYKTLDYFDIAEKAIAAKGPKPVDAADAFAQITLAGFHLERARTELNESLKRYKAQDKIALTDAFKRAVADYKKFITDRPTHKLAPTAVQSIYDIARIFEHHKAYDVAIGVYKDFAAFAAKSKVLSQGSPISASQAENAELIAANALYAKAENALTKTLGDAKPNDPPPAKINAEFGAAINAYKAFIKARPQSLLVRTAIGRINRAAMKYVSIGSWDAAESIFADLLAAGLDIRNPERLEFCRGLCRLGKVMPAHAKDVLKALTTPRKIGAGSGGGVSIIALGGDMDDAAPGPDPVAVATPKPAPKMPRSPTAPSGSTGRFTAPIKPAEEVLELSKIVEKQKALADNELRESDALAMATIRRQNTSRASRIAMLRDEGLKYEYASKSKGDKKVIVHKQQQIASLPVLSDAEIARQEKCLFLAYDVFQSIRRKYAKTSTADQARGEIMVMIGHWRSIARWAKSAAMVERFLTDNPTDLEMPKLRMSIATDYLSWAAQPVKSGKSTQEMLTEVAGRFGKARKQLEAIVADLPDEKKIVHQAQWAIANSFLTQARVVNAFSATLARGQYVRAGRELLKVAAKFHDHPQIGSIPQMLWTISAELSSRGYHTESIVVCTDLANHYPTNSMAQQASLKIAQTYQNNLRRPLRAAEAYIELNFARGGNDAAAQAAMFQIGAKLKGEKRWVEALHVLESFVDSFPLHAQAGQALTNVGQIHQANEAWDDAIAAYKRVINEFASGVWVKEAKWSIAECTINLSRWREASDAYKDYLKTYAAKTTNAKKSKAPIDPRLTEATRRISVLKDLARYQILVDEKGQRKAFDAQYQIAAIVASKLSNPVKAIIEYRKVTANWPASHFADDALFKVGTTYLSMKETAKARKALLEVGAKYPNSPLADDALYMVGQSYETEAASLGSVTRASTITKQRDLAQKLAYGNFAAGRRRLSMENKKRIAQFKAGKDQQSAELEQARGAFQTAQFNTANAAIMADFAEQQVVALTAKQLADRQDKINAALRQAVSSYRKAAGVAAADKADESLLRMATIYAERLKDADAAMKTYLEIVRQFSGTSVAEDASWRIAQYYEQQEKAEEAVTAYKAFLRNYRRSSRAGSAQFAIAENYEHAGQWVQAMDAYTNYITNFPTGPMVAKAKEQISWIKTYRL